MLVKHSLYNTHIHTHTLTHINIHTHIRWINIFLYEFLNSYYLPLVFSFFCYSFLYTLFYKYFSRFFLYFFFFFCLLYNNKISSSINKNNNNNNKNYWNIVWTHEKQKSSKRTVETTWTWKCSKLKKAVMCKMLLKKSKKSNK